ncbi:subtilisin-like serine protease [Chloropicon primus]|nr:subtilisin-like serine protease [Chloropicon primus]
MTNTNPMEEKKHQQQEHVVGHEGKCPALWTGRNLTVGDAWRSAEANGRDGGVEREGREGLERADLDFTASVVDEPVERFARRFVVTFRDYKLVGEHRARLTERLNTELNETQRGGWNWVDRKNAAVKYPTDFGVVSVTDESVLPALRGVDMVKGIFADNKIAGRGLLSTTESDYRSMWDKVAEELGPEDILVKGPGRLHGPFSSEGLDGGSGQTKTSTRAGRTLKFGWPSFKKGQLKSLYKPEKIWKLGFTGQKIRVGIFDTGVRQDHPDLKHVEFRSNFTHQQSLSDGLGHGSFVAGCIASVNPQCPANAPDAELYTFKVFTDDQESFTSWYLDAVNFAMIKKVHIINVSIGGPDYSDTPFVDKFKEAAGNGIIVIVAMGNMGPLWGTANNPGDEMFTIGVGGHNSNFDIANFQVRGMTIQEAPYGYGRIKPDVVTYGEQVSSLRIERGCKESSGTSIAAPVATGLAALIASSVPEEDWYWKLNPASMKQVLMEGADKLRGVSIYAQGPGKANLAKSFAIMQTYKPKVTIFPPKIDLLDDMQYMWPHSRSPLYASAMPLMMNLTITNGLGSHGYFKKEPVWTPTNTLGRELVFKFEHSNVLWPWSGYLGLFVHVKESARFSSGRAKGTITFTIHSPPFPGEKNGREQEVKVDFTAMVIPTPPRNQRVLWDDYHNIQYPPDYIPIDDLEYRREMLDWNGDHPHTNFREVFNYLTGNGYYVEVLGSSMTCFDASNYGTLVLCDSEGEFHQEEIAKLESDVKQGGLGLLVIGEWYNRRQMQRLKIFDDNTRSIWSPIVGGGNVPALNRLLSPFGIAFSDEVTKGQLRLGRTSIPVGTGTSLHRLPPQSSLFSLSGGGSPVLGLTAAGKGKVVAYCDTSAFDENLGNSLHPEIFLDFVSYASGRAYPSWIRNGQVHNQGYVGTRTRAPGADELLEEDALRVLKRPMGCHTNAPLYQRQSQGAEEVPKAKEAEPVQEADKGEPGEGQGGRADERVGEHIEEETLVGRAPPTTTEPEWASLRPRVDARKIFEAYYQRQIYGFLVVIACLALLFLWKRISTSRRNKIKATKNRYTRLRQIV